MGRQAPAQHSGSDGIRLRPGSLNDGSVEEADKVIVKSLERHRFLGRQQRPEAQRITREKQGPILFNTFAEHVHTCTS